MEAINVIVNAVAIFLFFLSEIIGYSKCSANGVVQLAFNIPCVSPDVERDIVLPLTD